MYYVISTRQYQRKSLIFAIIEPFLEPTNPQRRESNFEKFHFSMSFISVFQSIIFPFYQKTVKKHFYEVFPMHLHRQKL